MVSLPHAEQQVLNNTFSRRNELSSVDSSQAKPLGFQPFGKDGLSFLDLIDTVNPMHHIPIIGPIYRSLTGDILNPLPRIAGSALFGGPIGASLSAAEVVLEVATGRDTGAHILTLLPDQLSSLTPPKLEGQSEVKDFTASNEGSNAGSKIDPVSAWARAELAYRSGLAARKASLSSYKNLAL